MESLDIVAFVSFLALAVSWVVMPLRAPAAAVPTVMAEPVAAAVAA